MDNPTITYDELKAALEKDACGRETEPALFALLDKLEPTPPLFGRWAEHPEYGRGIIASSRTDDRNRALFGSIGDPPALVAQWRYVPIGELTLDPATLTTQQDFEGAPEGTIAEATTEPNDVYVKAGVRWYIAGYTSTISSKDIPACRVIRWGDGK